MPPAHAETLALGGDDGGVVSRWWWPPGGCTRAVRHREVVHPSVALSVARLARRRMVGFDGRGRSLWRGSRRRPRTLIRAHPLFRILQRFDALSPVAGDD